jgi:putative spermidine/putrescine transport system ATP-binding protein
MVVLEGGRIRQAGAPRDVFERPADAFVARFIGGHNVLRHDGCAFAVRADRCRVGPPDRHAAVSGRIAAVEYQGPVVRVAVALPDGDEAVALMPDDLFHASPVSIGDAASLTWSLADAHAFASA